jgi:osmotically-inducible protein OsmY
MLRFRPPRTRLHTDVRALIEGARVRRERTMTDRRIAKELREVVDAKLSPGVKGLNFYVVGGAVSVYGRVATYAERDLVMEAMSSVPGITRITDHIRVLS